MVVRYNSDGSLDTGFDSDGKLSTDFGSSYDYAIAVALQDDGKIVVAGSSSTINDDFAVVRYNSNGSPDTGFDTDGKVTTHIGVGDTIRSIALQTDGKIVAAGYTGSGTSSNFSLIRYNP